MQHPFFSIIVPVYNVEKYLLRFLESVANQTFTDYEVLLVDDGSPDRSGVICDEFCAEHPQFRTIHKPNGGVSSARNRGIDESKGDWLLFFDSDDLINHKTLERINDAISEYPTLDAVIYSHEEVLRDESRIERKLSIESPAFYNMERLRTDILPYFCYNSFLNSPWSKCFKRSIIIENNLCFKKRVRGEDWLFCLEYFRHISSAATIPDALYYYMRNEDSAMSKYVPEQFQLWSENWDAKLALAHDFQLKVDKDLMCREMYHKIYYFIKEIREKEPLDSRKQKLQSILHSDLLSDTLRVRPKSIREWRAYLYIQLMKLIF